MKQRVECNMCERFIGAKFVDDKDYVFSEMIEPAKCKLGKRVMFRMPKLNKWGASGLHYDDGGYIRYCNEYKEMK